MLPSAIALNSSSGRWRYSTWKCYSRGGLKMSRHASTSHSWFLALVEVGSGWFPIIYSFFTSQLFKGDGSTATNSKKDRDIATDFALLNGGLPLQKRTAVRSIHRLDWIGRSDLVTSFVWLRDFFRCVRPCCSFREQGRAPNENKMVLRVHNW